MKVVGLITEYNPFHNGHKYHIEQARNLTGADYVIAVMSGNFVQRGAPAVIDKYSRTKMALQNGVDLVLELPVCYATGSAEFFAHGAISILDKLGVVDAVCFGSECGDISLLTSAAEFLLHAPKSFETQLQDNMKEGLTYPAARSKALEQAMGDMDTNRKHSLSMVLTEPNNILGVEYSKALINFSSGIEPITIKRISAHYHEKELSDSKPSTGKDLELCDPVISSATAIRNALNRQEVLPEEAVTAATQSVPETVAQFLKDNYQITYPILEEDFASILRFKLRGENTKTLATYLDITTDLAERLKNMTDYNKDISVLIQDIKTKNMTLTRINRAIIHVLLNITTGNVKSYMAQGWTPYARILGIRKESSPLLRRIEKNGRIPIITKVSKADKQLDKLGMQMLAEDIFATDIYNQVVYEKFGTKLLNEYKHGICIL
jgi:predicted nucleotidyltransferase